MPRLRERDTFFTSPQACEYLEMDMALFRYHVYEKGHLKPDHKIGTNLIFKKETLDTFNRLYRTDGLTMTQAAAYLGVEVSWIRHHIFNTRLLVADGKRGRKSIFTTATLDAFKSILPKQEPEPA